MKGLKSLKIFVYMVLLGMIMIHVPKTVFHECDHQEEMHAHDDHSSDHDLPSFDADDCDICSYTFHALDLPDYNLVDLPEYQMYSGISTQLLLGSCNELYTPDSRGPPNSSSLS